MAGIGVDVEASGGGSTAEPPGTQSPPPTPTPPVCPGLLSRELQVAPSPVSPCPGVPAVGTDWVSEQEGPQRPESASPMGVGGPPHITTLHQPVSPHPCAPQEPQPEDPAVGWRMELWFSKVGPTPEDDGRGVGRHGSPLIPGLGVTGPRLVTHRGLIGCQGSPSGAAKKTEPTERDFTASLQPVLFPSGPTAGVPPSGLEGWGSWGPGRAC